MILTFTLVIASRMDTTEYIIYVLGLLTAIHLSYRLIRFVYLYFIQPSALTRYLHGDSKSYALVTGASDGIGIEMVKQLLAKGFNVILHGRNQEKLASLQRQLEKDYPSRKSVIIAATADDPLNSVPKIETLVKEIESQGGRFTVLINNVGGTIMYGASYRGLDEIPYDIVDKQISLNLRFPTLLTRILMPILKANKPSLIINVGSYAGEQAHPWLPIYSPSKAYNHAFSMSLTQEMRANKVDIEVLGVLVAQVESAGNFDKPGFNVLTSEQMARDILARVGCGMRLVCGSWRHCVFAESVKWLPKELEEWIYLVALRERKEVEQRRLKAQ